MTGKDLDCVELLKQARDAFSVMSYHMNRGTIPPIGHIKRINETIAAIDQFLGEVK